MASNSIANMLKSAIDKKAEENKANKKRYELESLEKKSDVSVRLILSFNFDNNVKDRIDAWNNIVKPTDIVYVKCHIGNGDLKTINSLSGRKIYLKDKLDGRDNEVYIRNGFERVIEMDKEKNFQLYNVI